MKTKVVAILNPAREVCGFLTAEKGVPVKLTASFHKAYHFAGLTVDGTTPEQSAEYFIQEHRGIEIVNGEEREYDYTYEVWTCTNGKVDE